MNIHFLLHSDRTYFCRHIDIFSFWIGSKLNEQSTFTDARLRRQKVTDMLHFRIIIITHYMIWYHETIYYDVGLIVWTGIGWHSTRRLLFVSRIQFTQRSNQGSIEMFFGRCPHVSAKLHIHSVVTLRYVSHLETVVTSLKFFGWWYLIDAVLSPKGLVEDI